MSSTVSPWHVGERALQQRMGVADRMEVIGQKVVRDHMPEQHREFFQQLPIVLLGSVDSGGDVWASALEGAPGFVRSPDPKTLQVRALPMSGDPAADNLLEGSAAGLLGIELHTRRRNRVNGSVLRLGDGFRLAVHQSFGNCPQYIQLRTLEPATVGGQDTVTPDPSSRTEHLTGLDEEARAHIRQADTFFVASYVEGTANGPRQVDVSHRGGMAGFVRVDENTLTVPDFSGNLFFNTLGNLYVNPRAGLLFIDFETGDLLQMVGSTELVLSGPELEGFAGAERIWRLKVTRAVRHQAALRLRWRFHSYSSKSLLTGAWSAEPLHLSQ